MFINMLENKLPEEFKSIEEIQDFWDTHSSAEYWDEMADIDLQLSPALQARLEMKKLYRLLGFSPDQIDAIESKAQSENVNSKLLIRNWVLEHV